MKHSMIFVWTCAKSRGNKPQRLKILKTDQFLLVWILLHADKDHNAKYHNHRAPNYKWYSHMCTFYIFVVIYYLWPQVSTFIFLHLSEVFGISKSRIIVTYMRIPYDSRQKMKTSLFYKVYNILDVRVHQNVRLLRSEKRQSKERLVFN